MLAELKLKNFLDLVNSSTNDELIWMNGYLSGTLAKQGVQQASAQTAAPAAAPAVNKITIAYGTETGNSKKLATEFGAKAKKSGINAKVVNLEQYRLTDLPKEEYLLTIVSTQGEGDPPAGAKKFFDHIHNNGFKLDKLKYGVLALGDSSYPLFCKAGEEVDEQLNKMGGERLVPLIKCDVDYENDAEGWFMQVMHQLSKTSSNGTEATSAAPAVVAKKSTGKKIYNGTVLTNINLNDIGSNKETHHIEIAADDIEYLPGDSLGVIPENPQRVVEPIVELLGIDRTKTFYF
jgi:sulfite reductase (NADPH) flavoprotein alpha-component